MDSHSNSNSNSNINQKEPQEPKKPKKPKFKYFMFLLLSICVGVMISLLAFAMVLNKISNRDKVNQNLVIISPSPTILPTQIVDKQELKNFTGVIENIYTITKEVFLYDFEQNKKYELMIDITSTIKDKYNNEVPISELKKGDIVNVLYNTAFDTIVEIIQNSESWEKKNTTGVIINSIDSNIVFEKEIYNYNNNVMVINKDANYDIKNITQNDTLTLKGYRKQVLFIEIEKGHGIIKLVNYNKIKNPKIEIGDDVESDIGTDFENFTVSEGNHKILVTGDNIEPYITIMQVVDGISEILNLDEVEIKKGILDIKSNQEDYTITINNKKIDATKNIQLEYGIYDIKATKDLFFPIELKVEIKSVKEDVVLEFVKIIQTSQVKINTQPQGANIYLDNVNIGVSPMTVSIEYGQHIITATKSGFTNSTSPIEVDKESVILNIVLQAVVTPKPTPTPTPIPKPTQVQPTQTPSSEFQSSTNTQIEVHQND